MPQKRTGAGRRRPPQNKKTLSAVISAVIVLAAVLVYYFPELETYLTGEPETSSSVPAQPAQSTGSANTADCAVYFLDVGQGDSILIQIGTDYNMLIDASVREAGDTIESDLKALGVTSLDAVVATHPHADHIGSMEQIIKDYSIGTFYMFCPRKRAKHSITSIIILPSCALPTAVFPLCSPAMPKPRSKKIF